MIVFGPVPSRRLGRSLGINHIPPKTCPYACVYCQVGATDHMRIRRQAFYSPEEIEGEVRDAVEHAQAAGTPVDYLTFVPDGEPTLDRNLGETIRRLKPLGLRIAVISNAALITDAQAADDLMQADWVSLKVDSVHQEVWRRINRPHGRLLLDEILKGVRQFAGRFRGQLVSETMLVKGLNESDAQLEATADFLRGIGPSAAYISVPTRPPVESWVQPPSEDTLTRAFQIFSAQLPRVEYLISPEGDDFTSLGEAARDLLAIVAVHPMREEAVQAFLTRTASPAALVEDLLAKGALARVRHGGDWFYLRRSARS